MTGFRFAPPLRRPVPGPVVDPEIDGVFNLPPSRDTRREMLAVGTILAALLLHLLFLAILVGEWRSVALPPPRPLQVTLVREPPPPPPPPPEPKPEPPKPKAEEAPPKPKVEQPKPPPEPPKPAEMKPRESGADEKTEAAKSDKPKSDLPKPLPIEPKAEEKPPPPQPPAPPPEPKAEELAPVPEPPPPPPDLAIENATPTLEPLPPPPDPKPAPPPRLKPRAPTVGQNIPFRLDELPPAFRPPRPVAPTTRNLTVRLPSPGGGSAERDYAGDAYLNRLMHILERNRVYPPPAAFSGTDAPVAAYSVLIEPSGGIVNITLLMSTGVPRIDESAREMISNSAPFPHVPADYPQIRTLITMVLPMFPRR